ncbi:AraC family transcriptional regulator [Oryzibacter oryziterrae]|uniref:AraC family transcriptional regulator n=1 Tax=Oryzibacter oryziterrae TaxID=2766474 RepID=UPI001F1CC94C|nr:AraC family transcriptional regulator [Oryzibacter oryziterrae]
MATISLPRGRQLLHTMPTSAGYDIQNTSEYNWDGRQRGQTPFTILQYTISGHGNLRHGDEVHRIHPGEAMLVFIPHNHRYWVQDGEHWEFFWISMHGKDALGLLSAALSVTGPILRPKPRTVEIFADCCNRLIEGEGDTPGAASALAYRVVAALYDDVFFGHTGEAEVDGPMARVVRYVGANLGRDLSVDALAAVAGLSRAHFSRLFAHSVGVPPAEFVLSERMRKASKLLAVNGDVSIKEVAALVGFDDPNYFSKVFRRHFGASPSEFRTTGMYAHMTVGNTKE